jgi:alpha-L-fucosidase
MLHVASAGQGNLLLNIGPAPDGSVPEEAITPLQDTGRWIRKHAEVVYPVSDKWRSNCGGWVDSSRQGRAVYLWTRIWPDGEAGIGGFMTPLKAARLLPDGTDLAFRQDDQRIVFTNLPKECPDTIANRAIIELEFEDTPEHVRCSKYSPLQQGKEY